MYSSILLWFHIVVKSWIFQSYSNRSECTVFQVKGSIQLVQCGSVLILWPRYAAKHMSSELPCLQDPGPAFRVKRSVSCVEKGPPLLAEESCILEGQKVNVSHSICRGRERKSQQLTEARWHNVSIEVYSVYVLAVITWAKYCAFTAELPYKSPIFH